MAVTQTQAVMQHEVTVYADTSNLPGSTYESDKQ
jgi:hypothetical protein